MLGTFTKINKIQIQHSLIIKTKGTIRTSHIGEVTVLHVVLKFVWNLSCLKGRCVLHQRKHSWLCYCQLWWS